MVDYQFLRQFRRALELDYWRNLNFVELQELIPKFIDDIEKVLRHLIAESTLLSAMRCGDSA